MEEKIINMNQFLGAAQGGRVRNESGMREITA